MRPLVDEGRVMGMDWEGPNSRSMGYGGFFTAQWMILIGALRIKDGNCPIDDIESLVELEDLEDFSVQRMVKLTEGLAEGDPIRKFVIEAEHGKLSPKESAALAARLAEITYFLTIKRQENEKFIFLPHMAKRRQFQDLMFNQIALFMWEFAVAAEKGIEIKWDGG